MKLKSYFEVVVETEVEPDPDAFAKEIEELCKQIGKTLEGQIKSGIRFKITELPEEVRKIQLVSVKEDELNHLEPRVYQTK